MPTMWSYQACGHAWQRAKALTNYPTSSRNSNQSYLGYGTDLPYSDLTKGGIDEDVLASTFTTQSAVNAVLSTPIVTR